MQHRSLNGQVKDLLLPEIFTSMGSRTELTKPRRSGVSLATKFPSCPLLSEGLVRASLDLGIFGSLKSGVFSHQVAPPIDCCFAVRALNWNLNGSKDLDLLKPPSDFGREFLPWKHTRHEKKPRFWTRDLGCGNKDPQPLILSCSWESSCLLLRSFFGHARGSWVWCTT